MIAAQDQRLERQSSIAVVAVPVRDDLPTITQSVITGGPSVAQTREVTERCPNVTKRAGAETITTTSTFVRPPPQCPADALVLRMRTQIDTAQQRSDSTSIVGYVPGRGAVGVLTETAQQASDGASATFCSLLTTVERRIAAN